MTNKIKSLLGAAAMGAGLVSLGQPAFAQERLDLTTPEGGLNAFRKVQCSMEDEKPIFYSWSGNAFSRRRGEPDINMFNVDGMNVRMCVTVDGGDRGPGVRLVTREILLYLDTETGEPLETWDNPWTGDTVKVLHVENDPVNQPPFYAYTTDGKPIQMFRGKQGGDRWWSTSAVPLFYHNVLQGDYQKNVGGVYHATEMFNFLGDLDSLTDMSRDTAEVQVGWVRMSDWLPWMEMQGREGIIYMHTAGRKVGGYDELSDVMKKYIEENAPIYKAPPPGDDDRPNETSWTYFQKMVEGEKLPRGGHN